MPKTDLMEKFRDSLHQTDVPITVIGDVMLDEYVTCDVIGHSPEDELAHKLKVFGTPTYKLGGAANVAHNLARLGLKVRLHGCVGDDPQYQTLLKMLAAANISLHPLVLPGQNTTVKTRYMTRKGRQVIRIDKEDRFDEVAKPVRGLCLERDLDDASLFVVSDYGKGTVGAETMDWLHNNGYTYIVDPKRSDFSFYRHPALITPNERELEAAFAAGIDFDAKLRLAGLTADAVLVTRGEKGSVLYQHERRSVRSYAVRRREVGDPAGCGDSAIAGVAFGLVNHWSLEHCCALGNACGACAMDHVGVNAVNPDEVLKELRSFDYRSSQEEEA